MSELAMHPACRDDGGSAFPQPDTHHANGQVQYGSPGMTLRDYFAAKAMRNAVITDTHDATLAASARLYYRMADAMLEARRS